MPTTDRIVRQSVSLPAHVARRVKALARTHRASASRILVDLIEAGLGAQDAERQQFMDLAERLASSHDQAERQRIKEQLARMTFGA